MNTAARAWYFVFVFGFIFQFLETWYFGWNWKAASPAELQCDFISVTFIVCGLIGMWVSKHV